MQLAEGLGDVLDNVWRPGVSGGDGKHGFAQTTHHGRISLAFLDLVFEGVQDCAEGFETLKSEAA